MRAALGLLSGTLRVVPFLVTGCESNASAPESRERGELVVPYDPLQQLAPGVFYHEHAGGVRIKMDYLLFDETSLPALRAKALEVEALASQKDDARSRHLQTRWRHELAMAERAYSLLASPAGQEALGALKRHLSRQGITLQAFGCSNNATARSTSSRPGAKADASASCGGAVSYSTKTEALASAAAGQPARDRDSGSSFSRSSAVRYGSYACSSSAMAESSVNVAGQPTIPAGRDTDSHRGC
jgi:hypothetical protein